VPADLGTVFVRWTWCRALLHRGWWLVTSVYLVVDAHLSAAELVLVGVAQGAVALVFEVPAGVVADAVSRKWSLVVSHALMGAAMLGTGLVTGFGPIVATQMVWGLAWTFASGADVAWVTDELDDPARIAGVLVRAGRAQLTGAVAGMVGVGILAGLTHRDTAMVLSGVAMLLLGGYVAAAFQEGHERRAHPRVPVRGNRVLLVLFAATFLVNGVAGTFGRLYPLRLVRLGLPTDPVAWFTVLGVLTFLAGAVALRLVQPHIDGVRTVRRGYLVACAVAAAGAAALVAAPETVTGSVAVLLAMGALPLTRTFATIWVNRQATAAVRATVHSLVAQAEYLGAIGCGLGAAAVARFAGLGAALLSCAAALVVAIGIVTRAR
jgi:MFS family permease